MGFAPAADSIAEALNRRRDQIAPLDRHFLDYLTATDGVTKLKAIRRVVEIAPGSDYLNNAGANPYLEPLWNYPPFKELLRPKG